MHADDPCHVAVEAEVVPREDHNDDQHGKYENTHESVLMLEAIPVLDAGELFDGERNEEKRDA